MRIGFIGAGKVGFSLGRYLSRSGVEVIGYASRSMESARAAADFTGSVAFADQTRLVEACDLIFITVPDACISMVFDELVTQSERGLLDGMYICHCSGSLSAREAFSRAVPIGVYAYSVHPLCAVNDRYGSYEDLSRVVFSIEGDPGHIETVRDLLEVAGNTVVTIESDSKIRYHAACSIALNLMTALVQESIDLLVGCGFSEEEALDALAPALRGNVAHIVDAGMMGSLTGPIERNDVRTVERHLEVLLSPEVHEIYRLLSLRLLKLAEERHVDRDYRALRATLGDA
jgi:predicted short-subunit dehydrogenase-like oxidoreductase (DUF2520 family)